MAFTKIMIRCSCGDELYLEIIGGQYQNAYVGRCKCGSIWRLEEQSEGFKEINDR